MNNKTHSVSKAEACERGPKTLSGEPPEKAVIPDECGDSLWDEVLEPSPDTTPMPGPSPAPREKSAEPTDVSNNATTVSSSYRYGKNYAELAFTDAIKGMQEKLGSRASYARMEKQSHVDGLTENETDFISQRDSFYMATIGENGYPYLQHRGGPKGFIKVLDTKRLGIIDFKGNAQYISVGNIATHQNVALIMVDYPARARLKIYAKAKIVELSEDQELYKRLDLDGYKFRPERMMVFNVEAYDWNCPQHITPRYTAEEINEALAPQKEYITRLEAEVKRLKDKLDELTIL